MAPLLWAVVSGLAGAILWLIAGGSIAGAFLVYVLAGMAGLALAAIVMARLRSR